MLRHYLHYFSGESQVGQVRGKYVSNRGEKSRRVACDIRIKELKARLKTQKPSLSFCHVELARRIYPLSCYAFQWRTRLSSPGSGRGRAIKHRYPRRLRNACALIYDSRSRVCLVSLSLVCARSVIKNVIKVGPPSMARYRLRLNFISFRTLD